MGCRAFVVPAIHTWTMSWARGVPRRPSSGKWRKACDLTQLQKESASAPTGFNTMGWNSSYTRQPIPARGDAEWLKPRSTDILSLAPKALYEIGCGSGMLTMWVAPLCDRYVATDFSPVVLELGLNDQLQMLLTWRKRVECWSGARTISRASIRIPSIRGAQFRGAVFSQSSYLTKVLQNAVNIVKPGGHVFVGDIRSLPLLTAFASSVELFQAADGLSAGQLRDRIERRIRNGAGTRFVSRIFPFVASWLRKISQVEIQLRRGRADNEMTRYRYNAILYVGQRTEAANKVAFEDWTEREVAPDEIHSELLRHPNEPIGFKWIRNARIEKDLAALEILRDADATSTALELRREGGKPSYVGPILRTSSTWERMTRASGFSSVGRLVALTEVMMPFLFREGHCRKTLPRRSRGQNLSPQSLYAWRTPLDKVNFGVS